MNGNNDKKKLVHILRDKHGGVSEELKKSTAEQRNIIKKISKEITSVYKTIPEISESTSLSTDIILWYVMAMKKYGKITEGEEIDGYYKYTLKEDKSK